jgi:DNA polymerase III subunit delta'
MSGGRLPQALLIEGPRGVGKQRLALWIGQALLCEAPRTDVPCGSCPPCRLAVTLAHPDLHWFVPVELSKKGADADKQIELVEEALGEIMAERRQEPLYAPVAGLAAHGMASIRSLLRQLALTPVRGGRKVFIIGDAERLAAQRGQEGSANALLKALEEPPQNTVFILTAAEPEALLPTILSRVVRIRLGRLSDSVVTAFVQQEMMQRIPPVDVPRRVAAAQWCIGRLIEPAGTDTAGPALAEAFLNATRRGPTARLGAALAQPPFQARGAFTAMLDGLLERLRGEAVAGGDTRKVVAAMSQVLEARDLAQGNVNPQLLAAVLAEDLAEVK